MENNTKNMTENLEDIISKVELLTKRVETLENCIRKHIGDITPNVHKIGNI